MRKNAWKRMMNQRRIVRVEPNAGEEAEKSRTRIIERNRLANGWQLIETGSENGEQMESCHHQAM